MLSERYSEGWIGGSESTLDYSSSIPSNERSMPDVAGEAVHSTRVIVANLSAVRLFTGEVTVCDHSVATTAPFLLK